VLPDALSILGHDIDCLEKHMLDIDHEHDKELSNSEPPALKSFVFLLSCGTCVTLEASNACSGRQRNVTYQLSLNFTVFSQQCTGFRVPCGDLRECRCSYGLILHLAFHHTHTKYVHTAWTALDCHVAIAREKY
jgi:hypothetical protein